MTINSDLAQWGEPPASPEEEKLAGMLNKSLESLDRRGGRQRTVPLDGQHAVAAEPFSLGPTVKLLEEFATTVQEYSELLAFAGSECSGESAFPDPFPGEFRIVAPLGEGASGRVWLAEDLNVGWRVALKELKTPSPNREQALTALRNEARLLGSVRHPNVVQIHGVRQSGQEWYLVLQFVDGGSMASALRHSGPLPWERAARYIADVGEALVHVHSCGIIHRDVNPANMLWDSEKDEAILTDFGISCRLADSVSAAGTLPYVAPEAFEGELTPALDVFGLAATLFRLVTGDVPFPANTSSEHIAAVSDGLPKPDPRCAALPAPLERLIRKGLAPAAKDRPSLDEFVRALRGTLNHLLADSVLLEATTQTPSAPVRLRLAVSRKLGSTYSDLLPGVAPLKFLRDLKKVPPSPGRIRLSTGERIRVQVRADRGGYVNVFNVGPTGNLHLLWPAGRDVSTTAAWLEPDQPVDVLDVEVTPPCGRERLVATWSRRPLPFSQLADWARHGASVSRPYCATRDLERVRSSVQQLPREDWHAVVLELDHDE